MIVTSTEKLRRAGHEALTPVTWKIYLACRNCVRPSGIVTIRDVVAAMGYSLKSPNAVGPYFKLLTKLGLLVAHPTGNYHRYTLAPVEILTPDELEDCHDRR